MITADSGSRVTEPDAGNESFPLGAIEAGCPLFAGYRRVALDIDRAAWTTLQSDAAFEPDNVHALRVATKRLRAYWQLQKPTANAALAKRSIKGLRDAARTLAGLRDEHVLRSLLAELSLTADSSSRQAFEKAAEHLTPAGARSTAKPDDRRDFLEAIDSDLEDWWQAVALDDDEMLDAGLRRSFAKTRDLGRLALEDQAPEEMHRWRRWVKYLRYQVEPLASPGRRFLSDLYAELKELGSVLGQLNDLENLRHAVPAGEDASVSSAIESRGEVLASRIPALGATGLGSSSDDFLAAVRVDLGM